MGKIHLLSVDRTLAQRLTEALGERVTVEMVQSLELVDLGEPGIVVIDHAAIATERSLGSTIAAVSDSAPGRAIVLATDELETEQVLSAIRAGAADVIARNAEGSAIAGVLSRILNSVISTQGRPGRLTLVLGADREAAAVAATDMALAYSTTQTPTLLVDCTLPSSTAEAYLDIKVDYGLAAAVTDIDRMDASLLADALARHEPSGLSLLTFDGGTGAEPVGLSPNDVIGLIQLLRASCRNIVLCSGDLRNGGLLRELASQAQAIEIVCSQSIRELDSCRRLLDRVAPDTASLARMRLLVWGHDPAILLDGRRMADVMGIEALMGVPFDRIDYYNALNAGRPLYLGRGNASYIQAIRRVCNISEQPRGTVARFDKLRRSVLRSLERAV
ncbi:MULTISPECIES: histidine kinase [unclassified Novosphingobium]|uniref:AAA family ATPase n=1 Tax=unclassified Novosphingobium TaxID=2644732 RepID=UPI00020EFBDA|nr:MULTISPECIES: histidine kinase [unclassified Novosphingobium]GFM31501.1 pilus assembly protein CpaE [Novosphingobium sp. PY1]CCA90414.1 pilus assembly protein CpaE [Novosphingobium sp. PP1Y]